MAYALLVAGGVQAENVIPLAERLGLSSTLFYWHFPDNRALLEGLLSRSRARNTVSAVAAAMSTADATRPAAMATVFRRFGHATIKADTRARVLRLPRVGDIALRSAESFEVRLGRIPAHVLTFSGSAPTGAEIATFRARHKMTPMVSSDGEAAP